MGVQLILASENRRRACGLIRLDRAIVKKVFCGR